MRRLLNCGAICIAACLLALCMVSVASAQDWNSFIEANIAGVTVTPQLASGTLVYQVCLASNATLNGQTINWVQAFYALGETPSTTFTATNNRNNLGWTFNSVANASGKIAGWEGITSNRINRPTTQPVVCGEFRYLTFSVPQGSSVVPGFLIGFGSDQCGFFKSPVAPIPELPTSLLTFGVSLISGIPILRRKFCRH